MCSCLPYCCWWRKGQSEETYYCNFLINSMVCGTSGFAPCFYPPPFPLVQLARWCHSSCVEQRRLRKLCAELRNRRLKLLIGFFCVKPSFQCQGLLSYVQVLKGRCLSQSAMQERLAGSKARKRDLECSPEACSRAPLLHSQNN